MVNKPDFNKRVHKLFHQEWTDLEFEWEAFIVAIDYGYATKRMAIVPTLATPVAEPTTTTIAVDRGWQATPWLLRKGRQYNLTAAGRYQIFHDAEPWPCEPAGVTLCYHDGQPLGILLAVLRSEKNPDEFAKPLSLGLAAAITPTEDSVLYLRVNDSPAKLSDNQGAVEVRIAPISVGD